MFKDRIQAGGALARELKKYKNSNAVVLAIPKGGVPVGYEIARELELPMEIIFIKRLNSPHDSDYGIGFVGINESYLDIYDGVSESYVRQETEEIREKLKQMKIKFDAEGPQINLKNRVVILVDDGIAVGETILASLHIIKKSSPKKIIVAVPVASRLGRQNLELFADVVVCLLIPEQFHGLAAYYEQFDPVRDEEIVDYMHKLKKNQVCCNCGKHEECLTKKAKLIIK
jgi:putative phosphoribosyl transferase